MAGPLRPYPPPSLGLNGQRTFVLAGNGFWQFFSCPQFLENIVTTQTKYLPTNFNVLCPYLDKLYKVNNFTFKWQQIFLKSFKKSYFFLNGRPFNPPPLLIARPLREEFFLQLQLHFLIPPNIRVLHKTFCNFFCARTDFLTSRTSTKRVWEPLRKNK